MVLVAMTSKQDFDFDDYVNGKMVSTNKYNENIAHASTHYAEHAISSLTEAVISLLEEKKIINSGTAATLQAGVKLLGSLGSLGRFFGWW
jgi:hypothetical protein